MEKTLLGLTGEQLGIVGICVVMLAILLHLLRLERGRFDEAKKREDKLTDNLMRLTRESIEANVGMKDALQNNTETIKTLIQRINGLLS